jgi:TonB family protein
MVGEPRVMPPRTVRAVAAALRRAAFGLAFAFSLPALAQSPGATPRGSSGAIIKEEEQKPQPVLKEPVLQQFVEPEYPKEALAEGLEAKVVLKLTIDREGNVTNVEIPEPVGHGFDEAIRDAALKFKFSPATRDGKPFVVKWRFEYQFKLKTVEAPPPPPPTTGILSGKLRLAETDAPVVGADVVVVAADGKEQKLVTDSAGLWHAENLAPGTYHVRIALTGFEPVDSPEQVGAGEETQVTLRLNAVATELEVVVHGERPAREVTRRTVERREINRIPGTGGDALRSLQSLPGVARAPGGSGLLIVRGSAPQDTATFVDGGQIPLTYHFLGLTSVIPTDLLDKIDFYPGNFGVRYGRVSGGVVDVALRSPETRCYKDDGTVDTGSKKRCVHVLGQADFIDGRLMVQGPLPMKDWSFVVGARKSIIDGWLGPVLEAGGSTVTTAPVYYDYQAMAEHRTARERTSIRFYGSDDRAKLIINDPFVQDPALGGSLRFGTAFYRGQVMFERELNSRATVEASLSAGKDSIDLNIGNYRFNLEIIPISARYELGYKLVQGVKMNAGLDFQMAPFDVYVRLPDPPRPGEPDPGPYAARPPREVHNKGFGFRPAWYADIEFDAIDRLHLVPGLRVDYSRDTGHGDVAPRINGRLEIVKPADAEHPDRKKTVLKAGAGVYYQPPQFQETDEVFGTPNLYSYKATHYAVGIEQALTRQVDVSVEGFYKYLTSQVARGANAQGAYSYNNLGSGYVIGGEALIKYKPDQHFFGWLAYTLSRSVRRDGPGLPEYLFQFDQTHNLTVLGSYRLGRGWEFGARFTLVSGPLDTPVVSSPALPALYAADAGTYAKRDGKQFSERLPLRHQLDLRVDKTWQLKKARVSVYLDVQNAYNHPAVEGFLYNYNFSKVGYQTGVPIIPSLGFRVEN